jgi:hypothetical protein
MQPAGPSPYSPREPSGTAVPAAQQSARLTRLQQLTLTTWRRAAAKVDRDLAPDAILEQSAIRVALAVLRDTSDPMSLFARHSHAVDEFALVTSITPRDRWPGLRHDLLDTAFLLRWQELVTGAARPTELPPLRPRSLGPGSASLNSEPGPDSHRR